MTDTSLLQGTQLVRPAGVVPVPRVDQTMILPRAVKPRHLETGLFALHFGLDADIATTNGTVYPAVFATDTNKLYLFNGTAFVSVTLS